MRFWAFQRFATRNGVRDWTAFDAIVAKAKQHGKRLMFTFSDHWGACETVGGTRDVSWYVSGYKNLSGEKISYRDYVAQVVSRYRNEPGIAFWQLANEAEAKSLATGGCANGDVLTAFANDMASVIRAIDTNHLVSLGTLAGSQCGMDKYGPMHANMDVFEYHDYEGSGALPAVLAQRIDTANAANKPILMGELGRVPDAVGGYQARADMFDAKISAQFQRGADAALVWNFHDSLHPDPPSSYGINAGDPVWSMLGRYEAAHHRAFRPRAACGGLLVHSIEPPVGVVGQEGVELADQRRDASAVAV